MCSSFFLVLLVVVVALPFATGLDMTLGHMIRQSINLEALGLAAVAFRRPGLLIPHLSVDSIEKIDFVQLQTAGIQAICFDKDNTLTLPYKIEATPEAMKAVADAISVFGVTNCVILSNSAGTLDDAPDFSQAKQTQAAIGLTVVKHKRKKPDCLQELLSSFSAKVKPSNICVIGDRLLTDVFFAHQHGMFALHINRPLSLRGDNFPAILIRSFENRIFLPLWRAFFHKNTSRGPPSHPVATSLFSSSPD